MRTTFAILTLILLSACGGGSNGSDDNHSELANPARLAAMASNPQGNMTLLNTIDEPLIVSTSASFKTRDGRQWRLTTSSATIDLRSLGGPLDVLHLHVMRESDLQRARRGTPMTELEVIRSPAFTIADGGTWNPYGALRDSSHNKTGTLVICNYTDDVVGISIGHPMNALQGLINRGSCNVPLPLPANGLMDIYALAVPSLAVLKQAEVAIFEGQRTTLVIGEKPQPISEATLSLTSNIPWHVNVHNAMTGQPLYNSACNHCSTVMAGGSGSFKVTANVELQLVVNTTDNQQQVLSPIIAIPANGRADLLLQLDDQGKLEIVEMPAGYSNMCLPEEDYWLNLYYCS